METASDERLGIGWLLLLLLLELLLFWLWLELLLGLEFVLLELLLLE